MAVHCGAGDLSFVIVGFLNEMMLRTWMFREDVYEAVAMNVIRCYNIYSRAGNLDHDEER